MHDWIKSTLGHGETMCSRCFITDREAAAINHRIFEQPPAGDSLPRLARSRRAVP